MPLPNPDTPSIPREYQRRLMSRDAWVHAVRKGESMGPGDIVLTKDYVAEVKALSSADLEGSPGAGAERVVRFTVSTGTVDRDSDTVSPEGWDLTAYRKAPRVLWAHDYALPPIGRAVGIRVETGRLVADDEFMPPDLNEFADMIYRMVKGGWLNSVSAGFAPKKWRLNEDRHGVDFLEQELLEHSLVPVPSNPDSLEEVRAAGIDLAPLRSWVEKSLDLVHGEPGIWLPRSKLVQALKVADGHKVVFRIEEPTTAEPIGEPRQGAFLNPTRWTLARSKAFDITRERFEARDVEFALAAKYLDCEIKDLWEQNTIVPPARMGAFLTALDELLATRTVEDIRKLTSGGREAPPVYESVQLNSTLRRSFLVDGIRFLRGAQGRGVLKVEPDFRGLAVTEYNTGSSGLLTKVLERAASLNFLKGEAFALSGDFIAPSSESWKDLFLEPRNETALRRTVSRFNALGLDLPGRGVLLMGPPGTGKTMAGRVIRNEAKGTFIWVSARDFHYAGAFGGLSHAFELARECAPSVIFVEDVDNWLDGPSIDLMKTEMDGLAQKNAGVVTILTTNFPELLPEALIDRPGRFHDVLRLALPTEAVRTAMLRTWLPALDDAARGQAVKATAGFSGAHVKELASFIQIIADEDACPLDAAVTRAVTKLQEQRDLITAVQTQGSHYRPRRDYTELVPKALRWRPVKEWDESAHPREPAGGSGGGQFAGGGGGSASEGSGRGGGSGHASSRPTMYDDDEPQGVGTKPEREKPSGSRHSDFMPGSFQESAKGATTMKVTKAEWTAAYINDLPDASFAYIAPGGTKDGDGKTTPRSLRHLPYKGSDGAVDEAHTRNALARLPQTDIPADAKASARKKLEAAARSVGIEVGSGKAAHPIRASLQATDEGRAFESALSAVRTHARRSVVDIETLKSQWATLHKLAQQIEASHPGFLEELKDAGADAVRHTTNAASQVQCHVCGLQNNDGDTKCQFCGAALKEPWEQPINPDAGAKGAGKDAGDGNGGAEGTACSTCDGTGKIRGGKVVCPDCGGSGREKAAIVLRQPDDGGDGGGDEEVVTEEAKAKPVSGLCPECHKPTATADKYCAQCGAKLPKSSKQAGPGEDAEEAAELVLYKALSAHCAAAQAGLDEVKALVADLITAESGDEVADETAEEVIEEARFGAVLGFAQTVRDAMYGVVMTISSLQDTHEDTLSTGLMQAVPILPPQIQALAAKAAARLKRGRIFSGEHEKEMTAAKGECVSAAGRIEKMLAKLRPDEFSDTAADNAGKTALVASLTALAARIAVAETKALVLQTAAAIEKADLPPYGDGHTTGDQPPAAVPSTPAAKPPASKQPPEEAVKSVQGVLVIEDEVPEPDTYVIGGLRLSEQELDEMIRRQVAEAGRAAMLAASGRID